VTAALMAILIGLAALSIIAFELLGPAEPWDLEEGSGILSRLRKRRERLLRAIKDLEFEHQAGGLSEEEFRRLRNDFKARAVEATRDLERVRKTRLRSLAGRRRGGPTPAERRRIEELVKASARRYQGAAPGPRGPADGGKREPGGKDGGTL
jgi:hypothetical protein